MAYIDGKCYHTCPNCKREYFHIPDTVWGCLFMLHRPCGCNKDQLSLFQDPAFTKVYIPFRLEN